jgi:hypothetical protein
MVEKNIEVFISYADKDEKDAEKFKTYIHPLVNGKPITLWDKSQIMGGVEPKRERDRHLNSSQLILLLVSHNSLADKNCDEEVKRAVERYEAQEAHVIPIIIRPASWQSAPFNKLKVLPDKANNNPQKIWCSDEETFVQVAEDIHKVIEDIRSKTPPNGWEHITHTYLEDMRLSFPEENCAREKLIKFFDGRLPDWDDAQLPKEDLPQRDIVCKLEEELENARQEGRIRVILLEGAAGEGKSTALMQTVCNLVRSNG